MAVCKQVFMISIVLFIFGFLCIFYDFALIVTNPGTFLDNLTSFSHIWTVIGCYHIFLGIYRNKLDIRFGQAGRNGFRLLCQLF